MIHRLSAEFLAILGLVLITAGFFLTGHMTATPLQQLSYVAVSVFCLRYLARGGSVPEELLKPTAQRKEAVAVVTGAAGAMGREVCLQLGAAGIGTVILATRRKSEAEDLLIELQLVHPSVKYAFLGEMDLTCYASVREWVKRFEAQYRRLDVLINNAASMPTHFYVAGEQGHERAIATNFLGPLLLTELLMPTLRRSNGRVVNVASCAHLIQRKKDGLPLRRIAILCNSTVDAASAHREMGRSPFHLAAYALSKLCVIYMTQTHNAMYGPGSDRSNPNAGVISVCLHPGISATPLFYDFVPRWLQWLSPLYKLLSLLVFKTAKEAAQTTVYCALEARERLVPGGYYMDCKEYGVRLHSCLSYWARDNEQRGLVYDWGVKQIRLRS